MSSLSNLSCTLHVASFLRWRWQLRVYRLCRSVSLATKEAKNEIKRQIWRIAFQCRREVYEPLEGLRFRLSCVGLEEVACICRRCQGDRAEEERLNLLLGHAFTESEVQLQARYRPPPPRSSRRASPVPSISELEDEMEQAEPAWRSHMDNREIPPVSEELADRGTGFARCQKERHWQRDPFEEWVRSNRRTRRRR